MSWDERTREALRQLREGNSSWALIEEAEAEIQPAFRAIELTKHVNQQKVLEAFRSSRISEEHLGWGSGYGYADLGREGLESVYALAFGAEAALVRPQIASGTHAISAALFGLLRPGDELLLATGEPYDTLKQVIGTQGDSMGSLRHWGVTHRELPLMPSGEIDLQGLPQAIRPQTKVVHFQRSRGYQQRPSLSLERLATAFRTVREINPDLIIFVDNCYGEFVETLEPTQVGADLMAGSLIKNPGGGLAPTGGYIVGRARWVNQAAEALVAPGIGGEVGPSLGLSRLLLQGFYLAPLTTGEALKSAVLAAAIAQRLGLEASPRWDEPRTDIVQQIQLGSPQALIGFCQGIQAESPVDAHVAPIPGPMPGYEDEVIMGAGTFIQGATSELSADGPLRPPYTAYLQGALTYSQSRLALARAFAGVARNER